MANPGGRHFCAIGVSWPRRYDFWKQASGVGVVFVIPQFA